VEGQPVQVPRSPRSAGFAGPLVGRQPRMSSRVGKVRLGPRVVQPQGFPGRGQLVSLEEALEQQVTPLPQIGHAPAGHPHPRTPSALAIRPQRHSTVRPVLDPLQLALDDADQAVQVGGGEVGQFGGQVDVEMTPVIRPPAADVTARSPQFNLVSRPAPSFVWVVP
jgi:hypothetical protein